MFKLILTVFTAIVLFVYLTSENSPIKFSIDIDNQKIKQKAIKVIDKTDQILDTMKNNINKE